MHIHTDTHEPCMEHVCTYKRGILPNAKTVKAFLSSVLRPLCTAAGSVQDRSQANLKSSRVKALTFVRPVWLRLQTSAARRGGATAVRRDSPSVAKKSDCRLPGGRFVSFKLVQGNILFLRKQRWSCRRSESSVIYPISDSGRVGTKHHGALRS